MFDAGPCDWLVDAFSPRKKNNPVSTLENIASTGFNIWKKNNFKHAFSSTLVCNFGVLRQRNMGTHVFQLLSRHLCVKTNFWWMRNEFRLVSLARLHNMSYEWFLLSHFCVYIVWVWNRETGPCNKYFISTFQLWHGCWYLAQPWLARNGWNVLPPKLGGNKIFWRDKTTKNPSTTIQCCSNHKKNALFGHVCSCTSLRIDQINFLFWFVACHSAMYCMTSIFHQFCNMPWIHGGQWSASRRFSVGTIFQGKAGPPIFWCRLSLGFETDTATARRTAPTKW